MGKTDEMGFKGELNRRFGLQAEKRKRGTWVEARSDDLLDVCRYAKENGFEHLSMVSVTDLIIDGCFELLYFLWSYKSKTRLVIRARIPREGPIIKSVSGLWKEAQIHERELHELFGVEFEGNPDLSALFLEGWKGEPPFRKNFYWRDYVRRKYRKDLESERAYFEVIQ